jgi:uncharacterized protein YbjQ (UPF0145 family)
MFDLILFLVLLTVGYVVGQWNERRHYDSIRTREKHYAKVLTFATRYPPDVVQAQDCLLVSGSVVIGSDYFKQVVAGLKTLIGGRLTSYETLLDRARREAILRMKLEAMRKGYMTVINVKFETTNISGGAERGMPIVQVIAYGTALRPQGGPAASAAPAALLMN